MSIETAKQGLNKDEIETLVALVRLGDSVELALQTVLSLRSKSTDKSFYYNGYCV